MAEIDERRKSTVTSLRNVVTQFLIRRGFFTSEIKLPSNAGHEVRKKSHLRLK